MRHLQYFLGDTTMTSLKLKTLLASLALAASGMAAAQNSLLNVSYDVAREFYKDYNAAFAAHYKKTTGQDVKIDQSHAGSSAQARAVNDGLAADVVTMNTTTDVQFLADSGVVAKDWAKKFPHDASPTTSTMLFLVRNGNPKGIKDWEDLIKPGVQVIVVNPKTGGNGRYAYLAAWGAMREKGGTEAQAAEFVGKLYKNVPILAKGGRDATATFLQRRFEHVRELPANRLECFAISVTGNRRALKRIEAPQIIKSENVICVCMRKEHRVHAREPMLERLLPQIRCRVDENPCAFRHVDVNRWSQASIAWIGRTARPTCTADHRDAVRRPGAQHRNCAADHCGSVRA